MIFTIRIYILCLAGILLLHPIGASCAEADGKASIWDSAVNSLLATGMYGIENPKQKGLKLKLQHSEDPFRQLTADSISLHSQAITLSYEGSSGLLGFSTGYLYTGHPKDHQPDKVFLGIDPGDADGFNPKRSWYMAFDLAKSYQYDNDISFTLGSTSMLHKHPLDTEEGKTFSMLFNMPISYKSFITITPEFQWARTLKNEDSPINSFFEDNKSSDTFYGGISISFSY